ncbi:hypothetical protein WJX73_010046 [Symbiochloris irregularis]|uniref:PUM-HD domain-containing protein n=1 Tax=Symbiochloris irregularis TaxID=706552 RepID=A0AAW1NMZ9_9CHLO
MLDQAWQVRLAEEFQGRVVKLASQCSSCRVIQQCLACIQPSSCILFIIQELIGTAPSELASGAEPGIVSLACSRYGSHVVRALLQHCDLQDVRKQAINELIASASSLANDAFGTFCIQWIMESGAPTHKVQLTQKLQDHVVKMSMQQHASRIVQQMLKFGSSEQQDAIVSTILGEQADGEFAVQVARMAPHRYGEFLIQDILAALIDKHGPVNFSRQLCERVEALLEASYAWAAAEGSSSGDWLDGALDAAARAADRVSEKLERTADAGEDLAAPALETA